MTVTFRRGKVVLRFQSKLCSFQQSLDPTKATKLALRLHDAAKKAAKKGKALSER